MATLQELTDRVKTAVGADSGLGKTLKFNLKGEGFVFIDGGQVSNEDKPADLTMTISLDDLRGRIIHLVLAGPQFAERRHQLAKLDLGSDVTTIVVPLDAPTTANTTVCVADDPDVIKAFALYRGRDPGQMERTDFLVDAAGSLHSIWYPGINWNDADMLKRRIEEIRQAPAPPRSRETWTRWPEGAG